MSRQFLGSHGAPLVESAGTTMGWSNEFYRLRIPVAPSNVKFHADDRVRNDLNGYKDFVVECRLLGFATDGV